MRQTSSTLYRQRQGSPRRVPVCAGLEISMIDRSTNAGLWLSLHSSYPAILSAYGNGRPMLLHLQMGRVEISAHHGTSGVRSSLEKKKQAFYFSLSSLAVDSVTAGVGWCRVGPSSNDGTGRAPPPHGLDSLVHPATDDARGHEQPHKATLYNSLKSAAPVY